MARIVGTIDVDILYGGMAADRISANAGDDALYGGGRSDVIIGGSGNDSLFGDYAGDPDSDLPWLRPNGADRLYGGTGDDQLSGDGGNDFLSGGDGSDGIDGGGGFDRITGGAGNDYITDFAGGASAWGDAGDDGFQVSAGRANGGAGNDAFWSSYAEQDAATAVTWTGGAGADYFSASSYLWDGHAQHTTIADFNPGEGDALRIEADDFTSGWHGDSPTIASILDSNQDGRLSALQGDGSGDLAVQQEGTSLSLHIGDDTLTLAHTASIDLAMFG